jgi:hypothetical protein
MTDMARYSASGKRLDAAGERDYLLSALRTAAARERLVVNLIETIGTSLRHRMIDNDAALKWLAEENLLDFLQFGPSEKTGGPS